MKNPGRLVSFLSLAAVLAVPSFMYASSANASLSPLEDKVRHELNMLPYYGVFDYISFRVDGDKVTLFGEVAQPVLKLDAEYAVKHIEGVRQVEDQLEVLPLSPNDNRIRFQTYRSIYGYGPLSRYVLGTHPSIHIIVKNGNVTLKGVVANKMDHDMANMRANIVPGVFSVKNELSIEQS
jgi:hyperosmotically inducible periplasmic protein